MEGYCAGAWLGQRVFTQSINFRGKMNVVGGREGCLGLRGVLTVWGG